MKLFEVDLDKIKRAEIQTDPFPHFIIRDFFDSSYLKSIRADFPRERIRESKVTSKSRYTIVHKSENFERLMNESLVWKRFYEQMCSSKFLQIIKLKYLETDNFAGIENFNSIDLSPQMDITFARKGYKRGIHLDRGFHFFNSFIYLNGHEEFGGRGGELQFHKVKNKGDSYDKFPPRESVTSTKVIPVDGNSLVGFFCCPWSYHSVVPMESNTGDRDFVYFALNEKHGRNLWPQAKVISEERRRSFISE